jgi:hypothetical protein
MQQSKMAVTDQPIKVFNNGNMPAPVKYEVNFTWPVPLVPWTYFSPLGWNAKQIPLGLSRGCVSVHWGVRDFTYVDDIVEGVTRVIDNPPAQGKLEARVSDSVTHNIWKRSEPNDEGGTNPDENRERGTACPDEISGTDAAPSPQHNATSKGLHDSSTDAPQSSPPAGGRLGGASYYSPPLEGLGEDPNKT